MDLRPDAELLHAAHSDPHAFGVFYHRHVRDVLAYLARRTDAEAGADLTAETFAAALTSAPTYDPSRGAPNAWLFGIAGNLLAAYFRTGRIERRAQQRLGLVRVELDDAELERIERLASLDVSAAHLTDALEDLPVVQREAVLARVVEERSYEEIGADQAVSGQVVRQRVSRGLATLRQRLGGSR